MAKQLLSYSDIVGAIKAHGVTQTLVGIRTMGYPCDLTILRKFAAHAGLVAR